KVSAAMFAAGAGIIGQYRECSFRIPGTGTFCGSDAANPTVGQKGRREEVPELRLEILCPESAVEAAVSAMRKVHSYEEPAFDVYTLRPQPGPKGAGRVGALSARVPLGEFAKRVRAALNSGPIQVLGEAHRQIQRVALACGAAGEFLKDAVGERADVLLTGEMRFHDCLAARSHDISLGLPGHYTTERFAVESISQQLANLWPELEVYASRKEQDPLSWH